MLQRPEYLTQAVIYIDVARAIEEDLGSGDKTCALIADQGQMTAQLITREAGILCGTDWATAAFKHFQPDIEVQWSCHDGDTLKPGTVLANIAGNTSAILSAERTALNFLQCLSGTATLTAQYVSLLKGTSCRLYDTRKTIPGLRLAQKYAVTAGGGFNHRLGLYDGILIKENHLRADSMSSLLKKACNSGVFVEIEVETLSELKSALTLPCDAILLDNFTLADVSEAVKLAQGKKELEVSGNVTLTNIVQYANAGVSRIAVGALTKCLDPLDLSLLVCS